VDKPFLGGWVLPPLVPRSGVTGGGVPLTPLPLPLVGMESIPALTLVVLALCGSLDEYRPPVSVGALYRVLRCALPLGMGLWFIHRLIHRGGGWESQVVRVTVVTTISQCSQKRTRSDLTSQDC
jgi:hypothetical protein